MSKKIIDISVDVNSKTIVWPGIPKVRFSRLKDMAQGDMVNDTLMAANIHSGTHVDAPLHFLKHGRSIEKIDLKKFIGQAQVVQLSGKSDIYAKDLQKAKILKGVKKILLKTDNCKLWQKKNKTFVKDFCALKPDAAQWLVDRKIDLVGIDYLSIQKFKDGPEVHQILLKAGVVILETLNLLSVRPGVYTLVCFPMKLKGVEAAPVRAVLLK